MKIWLINPYGPIPSEAWRTYCFPLIADALNKEGHEVIWWTSNFSHHFKKWRSQGWKDIQVNDLFKIRLVPTPGYKKNISFGRIFRDIVFAMRTFKRGRNETAPDCIVFAESPLAFGYAGQKLATYHNCPSINHQMDMWPELMVMAFPKYLQPLVNILFYPIYLSRRQVLSNVSATTALAAKYLEAVFKIVQPLRDKPSAIIYNGINVQAFREKMVSSTLQLTSLPVKEACSIWAVFAGSLGPSYDIETLCKVALYFKENNLPVHIIIAGDGPKKEYVMRYSQEYAKGRLHYVGQLSATQLATLYSKCDVGLCSYSESSNVEMPDKIYDYTAAGLAVMVSLRGEVKDIVQRQNLGFYYQPGKPKDLINKIMTLIGNRKLLNEMRNSSFSLGAEFDSVNQYNKIISVINSVINNKS